MKRVLRILPLITALFLTFASCRQDFFVNDGFTWGTTYHIVYDGDTDLRDSIRTVMAQIDSSLSMFNPTSTVSRINAGTATRADAHLTRIMILSQTVRRATSGAFDPTVAPLVNLWGFGPDGEVTPPDSLSVARVQACVGLDACRVEADGTIVGKTPDTRFDFSAIAKGYGVDCVAGMLRRNGCRNYMVEIGGEVSAFGHNPSGRPWRIQIDAPVEGVGHSELLTMAINPHHGATLASSGNYRNYRTDSLGRRYGHTIDPRTGYPAQSEVIAATVVGERCATADALATACMVLNADEALAVFEPLADYEALLVVARGDSLVIRTTPDFFDSNYFVH